MEKTSDNFSNSSYGGSFCECSANLRVPAAAVDSSNPVAATSTSDRRFTDDKDVSHYSYISISLATARQTASQAINNSSKMEATIKSSASLSTSLGNVPSTSLSPSRGTSPLPPAFQRRQSQSRPCSPPPATHFPPRRPSLSLPPSPNFLRTHRASLPFLIPSPPCSRSNSASRSPSNSRARSPSSPPLFSRSPRRRPARTPSPRPPLPPPAPSNDVPLPQQPANNTRPSSQPHKAKMRSR